MKIRPKVLFLLHLPPPIHGSSIMGVNIKKSQLLNNTYNCSYVNLLASKSISETGRVSFEKVFSFINIFAKVFTLLIYNRPNLCYFALTTTGAAFYRDLVLVTLLKLFRIKLVFHLHNKGVRFYQNITIYRICYRFLFNNTDVIILSKYLYSDIQLFVPESKIHVCPNGIYDENNNSVKLECLDCNNPNIVKILFFSNLIESKGVFILLEALALLKRKRVKFEGIFVGGEGDLSRFQFNERINKLNLYDSVVYLGAKYRLEKKEIFLQSDIFAFPTYYSNECFPLVLLEAMSYSLPIISTYEGGIRDIVEDGVTGFLVMQNNINLFAEKLEILITDSSLRRRMNFQARMKYEREFTYKKFESRLTDILQSIVDIH